jgi:hypothetical protein
VFDRAVQAFARPIFVPHQQVAVRSFTDEVNRKAEDNGMANHPEDFELHALAVYDEESGSFGPLEGGQRVLVRAQDVVRKDV